jgi:ferredoxin
MKIRVNREKCAGHGRCAAVAPNVYALDDDGYIAAETILASDDLASDALRGLRACPERIISIEVEVDFQPHPFPAAAQSGPFKR